MVIVDTSVWINHFRKGRPPLEDLLANQSAMIHPFTIGELACGHLKDRKEILNDLAHLPQVKIIQFEDILYFLEERKLWGKGLVWIDMYLLASAVLNKLPLWTDDKTLHKEAEHLEIVYALV